MSSDETVSDLLLRWEELGAQGKVVSAEELCRDRPELVEEVRRQVRALEAVYRVPGLLVAVSTEGADPARAKRVRDQIGVWLASSPANQEGL